MKRLRILHVIGGLAPGGAERQLVTLASFQAREHEVFVACLAEKGALAEEIEAAGIPVSLLGKRPGFDLAAFLRLARLLKKKRIVLIHTHLFSANLWGRLAALLAGTPIRVIHEHSTFSFERRSQRLAGRILAPFTDAAVCVSKEIARRAVRQGGLAPDRVALIRNGIRLEPYEAARARRPAPSQGASLVLSVGALEPRKDHRTFLQAARRLLERGVKAEFLIVGDGPLRPELESLARRGGHADAIRFLGVRRDVPDLLAQRPLQVSSTRTEGPSLALLEALAAG
ncbi:MAG: glycosyltransferase, partial [Planctomycetota bacterium]